MVKVKPFRALKARDDLIIQFSTSAYEKALQDPSIAKKAMQYSYLRILDPKIFEPGIDEKIKYQVSRQKLQSFLNEGVIEKVKAPGFYIYRQEKDGFAFHGIIGLASTKDFLDGKIKRHELTRVDKEKNITDYFKEVKINGSPVLLTFRKNETFNELLQETTFNNPEFSITCEDGLIHTVWEVRGKTRIEQFVSLFLKLDNLYIADGHHRCAASVSYAVSRNNPDSYFMAYILPEDQIKIFGYHRMVKDLYGLTHSEFLNRLENHFTITKKNTFTIPENEGTFAIYMDETCYTCKLKEEFKIKKSLKELLDVSILEKHILNPVLGIKDSRTDERIAFVEGTLDKDAIIKKMKKEDWRVCFLMPPIAPETIFMISDSGETLPPKSTWIEPKLRSGLLLHDLEEE